MQLHTITPTSADDVVIDAGSFPTTGGTITVNVLSAFCRSFTVLSTPANSRLNIVGGNSLRVFGNFTVSGGFILQGNGVISFESSQLNRIVRAPKLNFGRVNFSSSQGSWMVQDTLKGSELSILGGQVRLGTARVDFSIIRGVGGHLYLDTSFIKVSNRVSLESAFQCSGTQSSIEFNGLEYRDHSPTAHRFSYFRVLSNRAWLRAGTSFSTGMLLCGKEQMLLGEWQADTIRMPQGGSMLIDHNSIINTSYLYAQHSCLKWGSIECTVVGGTGTLNVGNSSPAGVNVIVRDISFGGAGWTASSHLKLGSVLGLTGSNTPSNRMYWVGGTGSWADTARWSYTSGGPVSGCLPGPLDTVIVDNNGGTGNFTVQLGNTDNRVAHSFLLTNTSKKVTVTGTGNFPLMLTGSLVLSDSTTWNLTRPIQFVGQDTNSVVDLKGKRHNGQLNFIGGGAWTFTDSSDVSVLALTHGKAKLFNGFAKWDALEDNATPIKNRWLIYAHDPYYFLPNGVIRTLPLRPKLIVPGSIIATRAVQLDNPLFVAKTDSSEIRITGVGTQSRFVTHNIANRWSKIHWMPSSFVGRMAGVPHRVGELKYECDGRMECNLELDTLTLAAGSAYWFPSSLQFKRLHATGNCNGYISMRPIDGLALSNWNALGSSNTIQYSLMEKIAVSNGSITAGNCINNGNVTGIVFGSPLSRTLYWVGGNGQWQDTAHWSLVSGGLGGECLPSPFDSVVIDNNSMTTAMTLSLDGVCMARDVVISTSTTKTVVFNKIAGSSAQTSLDLYGSLKVTPGTTFNWGYGGDIWGTGTWIRFRAISGTQTVESHGRLLPLVQKLNTANVLFLDSTRIGQYFQDGAGTVDAGGNYFSTAWDHWGSQGTFRNIGGKMKFARWFGNNTIDVPNSSIEINERYLNLTGSINSKGALIKLTFVEPEMTYSSPDTLVRVEFSNPNAQGRLSMSPGSHIGKMVFKGSCTFLDSIQCDTAMLANGRSYFFASNRTFRVKKWFDAHGDFCNPILMRATQQGQQAKIRTFDTVQGNFLEIRDLQAVGPKPFYAGNKSADQGGNTGIIWANKPGYVFGFGKDRYFVTCSGGTNTSYTLTTERFEDAAGFLWMTGSTADTMSIDSTGYYYVTAQYGGCAVTDTVGIFYNEVEFGAADTLLCLGTSLNLQVLDSNYAGNVSFVWSTGDTSQIALPWTVGTDTTLWFTATDQFGNSCSDTLRIRSLQYNSPSGGLTLLNCDTANLVQRLYTAFNWPLPDTYSVRWYGTWDSLAMTFQGWVAFDARFGGCWVRDSIPLYLGNPLGITPPGPNYCLGSTVAFSTAHPHSGYRYLWSTGDTTATTTKLIQATGYIKLRVMDDLGMTCTDSIAYVGGNSVVATLTPAVINGVQPWTDTVLGSATGAHRFYWIYNGDTLGSGFGISDSLIHTWNLASTGNLYFVGIDTLYGCQDTATAQVVISQNYPAYIPNGFTPNGDLLNDVWTIQLLNADNKVQSAKVFNRFGGLVYNVEDNPVQWDGKAPNGEGVQSGVYVYVIEFEDLNGIPYRLTGSILIVR